MATVYGVNYTKQFITVPSVKIPKGQQFGDVHVAYDTYTLPGAVLADGDIIKMMKLPKGAQVIDAILKTNKSMGTGGIVDVGFQANGVDAEDLNAFINQADGGGQALASRVSAGAAGLLKTFTAETQVVIDCTEASTNTDVVISLAVMYVIN